MSSPLKARRLLASGLMAGLLASGLLAKPSFPYQIVDTHQHTCYDSDGPIPCPHGKTTWSGQDAQFDGMQPSYKDLGDGTIADEVTGLMWVKARGEALSWDEAKAGAKACRVGAHSDWRMPSIKELYSLMDFRGRSGSSPQDSAPYLDSSVFDFAFGDTASGQRLIDAQDWSSTEDLAPSMGGDHSVFGVNFIDGRIKAYPILERRSQEPHRLFVRYVRGNPSYGHNDFDDQQNGIIVDRATGLSWAQEDSGRAMDWPEALAWVQACNASRYFSHDDWRLPNAKELQSLVDYRRGPDISDSPAIDPLFSCSSIDNEAGQKDFPYYWTGTTHRDNLGAVYICFGRAMGFLQPPDGGPGRWVDVHGAGAQRSDPKTGQASDYPHGHGPQGDAIRIKNYVRLVRRGDADAVAGDQAPQPEPRRPPGGSSAGPGQGSDPSQVSVGPPAEAVRACEGHAEGDTVTFVSPRGDSLQGICRSRGGALFAVPQRP
jgi:hypothetical protein